MLCLSVVLGGCPYSSEIPLDNPSVKVDPSLLGNWESPASSESYYEVSRLDDYRYRIQKKYRGRTDDDGWHVAFITNIGSDKFLNLMEDNEYYFYKVILDNSGTQLKLAPVTEYIDEEFTSSEEMKRFFEKYKDLSFFYDNSEDVYVKEEQ